MVSTGLGLERLRDRDTKVAHRGKGMEGGVSGDRMDERLCRIFPFESAQNGANSVHAMVHNYDCCRIEMRIQCRLRRVVTR